MAPAGLGVGGLLGEIPSRPQPRERKIEAKSAGRALIAAVVLAAGQSSRMGRNKLLLDLDGKPILCHAVDQVLAAGITEVIVVCGHQAARVRAALGERPVKVVEAREHRLGMSASLKAGIAALSPTSTAAFVLLGDMPLVSPTLLRRMLAAYNPVEGRSIVLPVHAGKRGNPVLWDRRYFADMQNLAGDVGARHLIGEYATDVVEIAAEDAGIFSDIDTPQAYAALRRGAVS